MADWVQDLEAAIELADNAVNRLHEIDPKNELLWFWAIPSEETADPFNGDEDKRRIAINDQFWNKEKSWEEQPGVIVTTIVTRNYFIAVKKEIERLSKGVEGNSILLTNKER